MKKWLIIVLSLVIAIIYFIITLFTHVLTSFFNYLSLSVKIGLFTKILSLPFYIPAELYINFNTNGNFDIFLVIISIFIYFIQFIIIGLLINYFVKAIKSDDENTRKKGIIILFVIILAIVLISLIIFFINFSSDSKCIKMANENDMRVLKFEKCISLCPVYNVKNDYSPERRDIPESSCLYYCSKMIGNYTDTTKCSKNEKLLEIDKNFGEDLHPCIMNMSNHNYFKSCIDENVKKYSYIEDLSNMQLEPYQIYNLTIENLDCEKSPPELTIKLNEGTNNLKFIVYTNGIQNIQTDAPNVGETKTILINESIYKDDYYPQNLTEVKVALSVNNYLLPASDSKNC